MINIKTLLLPKDPGCVFPFIDRLLFGVRQLRISVYEQLDFSSIKLKRTNAKININSSLKELLKHEEIT